MTSRFCSIAGIALVIAFVSIATPISKAETYTSPAKASPIYLLQGEYMGDVEGWGGTWGAPAKGRNCAVRCEPSERLQREQDG